MKAEKPSMFYGAPPHIFEKARELRKMMTSAELALWERLTKKQLKENRFRRQHPISEFIADFYCHRGKLVVEVDGGIHNLKDQKDYDVKRTDELDKFGIKVIRFSNEEINEDIEGVLRRIERYLP